MTERPLGPQEALFGELTRRANGAIQLFCMAAFDQPADVDDVRSRLKDVHERHPMLRARIEDRDRLWWVCDVPFEHIDIRLQAMDPNFDLEVFYAAEAATPVDVTNVSWRAVLLTDDLGRVARLALITNHAAIDGRSALVVLNDLDVLLGDPLGLGPEVLPMAQSAEVGLAAAGLEGDRGLLPAWPDEAMWAVECPADSTARQPHALMRIFPASDLERLHRRLHRDGIHLAAGFCAAAVRASFLLPGRTDWTGIVAPTDVRADCQPAVSGNAVGEYVAGIGLLLEPGREDMSLLEMARALDQQLRHNRPASLQMDADVPLDQTREQADQMGAASDVFASGLCVSDVGDLNRLSGRRVAMSQVLLMPSQNHGIHPIMVAIVSTSEGACLSFGYDEPLRSRTHALAFADRYVEALTDMAYAI